MIDINSDDKINIISNGNDLLDTIINVIKMIKADLNSSDNNEIISASICASVLGEYFMTPDGFPNDCLIQRKKLIREAETKLKFNH